MRTGEGKTYLFVAVDRTSKYAYVEVHMSASVSAAVTFMRNLILAVPYKIHKVLTDNGLQFTSVLMRYPPKKPHAFDALCKEYGIEHRLTPFKHPWTNGQVERMNQTIKQATVKIYHDETVAQFKQHLHDFMNAYNHAKKLKTLRFLTPMQKILDEYKKMPHLFHHEPKYYLKGLNT